MIFLSNYFSKTKESKNNENKDIRIDGMRVNRAKNVIYFLLAFEPVISISILSELLTSLKIIKKRRNNRAMLPTNIT